MHVGNLNLLYYAFPDFCSSQEQALTLFRMGLLTVWGHKKVTPSENLPHKSYIDETWHRSILPKKYPKNL